MDTLPQARDLHHGTTRGRVLSDNDCAHNALLTPTSNQPVLLRLINWLTGNQPSLALLQATVRSVWPLTPALRTQVWLVSPEYMQWFDLAGPPVTHFRGTE